MAILLIFWVMFAGLGWWVAAQKGRAPEEGLILGLLFGPIGCVIEAMLPPPPSGEAKAANVGAVLKRIDDAINQTGKPPKIR